MSGIVGGAGSKSGIIGQTELEYEEGIYTPTITTTGGSYGLASGLDRLAYTRIGNMVSINGKLQTNSESGSGNILFSLPFTVADLEDSAMYTCGSCFFYNSSGGSIYNPAPITHEANSYFWLFFNPDISDNSGTILNTGGTDSSFEIFVHFFYQTSDG